MKKYISITSSTGITKTIRVDNLRFVKQEELDFIRLAYNRYDGSPQVDEIRIQVSENDNTYRAVKDSFINALIKVLNSKTLVTDFKFQKPNGDEYIVTNINQV